MLTTKDYTQAATLFNVEAAALMAVAEVEGGGTGFTLVDGEEKPIILYEPHVFWRELRKRRIDPRMHTTGNEDVLYEKWKTRPYPKTQAERYAQIKKASLIDPEAALCSASWGAFQIMGFNYAACGCRHLHDFVTKMFKDEAAQFDLFLHFLQSSGLLAWLQKKEWQRFAKGYNGAGYAENHYDEKLAAAYKKHSA